MDLNKVCARAPLAFANLALLAVLLITPLNGTFAATVPVVKPPTPLPLPVVPSVLTLHQQIEAAQLTASNANPQSSCGLLVQNAQDPGSGFYWEIGDQNGVITDPVSKISASGSQQPPNTGATRYTRDTILLIASASKWIYGAYAVEVAGNVTSAGVGNLPATYVPFLNFTSGYTNFTNASCNPSMTVESCMKYGTNNQKTASDVGKFYYNEGHLQAFAGAGDASLIGNSFYMANLNNSQLLPNPLTAKLRTVFGAKIPNDEILFRTTEVAGGEELSAAGYAEFLQAVIRENAPLKMAYFLHPTKEDPYAVCTDPSVSGCNAVYSPLPPTESWHYSITHWIEDAPSNGDGAYSSPGMYGFYPWIDATKKYYGIISRMDQSTDGTTGNGYESAVCGRAIRQAFITGQIQN